MISGLANSAGSLVSRVGTVHFAEWLLTVAVVAAVVISARTEAQWAARLPRLLSGVLWNARRQLILVGVLAVVLRALFLPVLPPPDPLFFDDHSLLLQAQTYAAGRMTNPTHPHWEHFQNFHINQQPTYASVFFPGRGLPMFLGYLFGHPWIGVWISVVLMSVAFCWMLQAWVPLPWALVGTILAILRFGVFSYWINSYFGGAVTAAAGALVLGALPRIMRSGRAQDGVWLGIGIVLLMTVRPYEGLLLCIPVAVALLIWVLRKPRVRTVASVAVPACLLVAAGALVTLYHSWRVTGRPTVAPYVVHRQTYALAPAFLLAPPYERDAFPTDRMRRFYEWEFSSYARKYSLTGVATIAAGRVWQVWQFYIGPLLTIPFFAGLLLVRSDRKVRFLVAALSIVFAGYLIETWGYPHYVSPAAAIMSALVAIGLHRLHAAAGRTATPARYLSTAIPVASALVLLIPSSSVLFGWPHMVSNHQHWCCKLAEGHPRETVRGELGNRAGRDLVLVRYSPTYGVHAPEWVYNDPDIDASEVVWAHDLGPQMNASLLEYFKDRTQWVIELSPGHTPMLRPYQATVSQAGELRKPTTRAGTSSQESGGGFELPTGTRVRQSVP